MDMSCGLVRKLEINKPCLSSKAICFTTQFPENPILTKIPHKHVGMFCLSHILDTQHFNFCRDLNDGQSEIETTPDLLSCSEINNFWISWEGGAIALGQHNYPESLLLQYVATDPSPTAVLGLASGPSNPAEFEYSTQFGNDQSYFLSFVIQKVIIS